MDSEEDDKESPVPRFGPEAKDTIEKSKQKTGELREDEFIHEEVSANPSPLLIWALVTVVVAALIWGGSSWYEEIVGRNIESDPFLQVTNREFSLFLWQNPGYMRANQKQKSGYLPAFQLGGTSLDPELAEQYVLAPPEVLFRYHTWNRLLKEEFTETAIPLGKFKKFLADASEWMPKYWPDASSGYELFLESLPKGDDRDLSSEEKSRLPVEVRIAFQGWKNITEDNHKIEEIAPTFGEMKQFLQQKPHYAPNYWQNIYAASRIPYLKSYAEGDFKDGDQIPKNELAPFLKAAFFNWKNRK